MNGAGHAIVQLSIQLGKGVAGVHGSLNIEYKYEEHSLINFFSFETGGLEPVLISTKNLRLTSYYIQFSTNTEMYNHKIIKS